MAGSAYIYFNMPVDTVYVDQNIWSDYYRMVVDYDSDADTLDEPNYDMYVPYLSWRIKKKKDQGLKPLDDPDYQEWTFRKNTALANEYLATQIRIQPNIDNLPFPS